MRFPFVLALAASLLLAVHISRGVAQDSNPIISKTDWQHTQAPRSSRSVPVSARHRHGIHPIGPRATLIALKTILGPTKLVAFASTDGLCIEVDHISPKSHAGACLFRPLPRHDPLLTASIGFSSGLGQSGVTELVGMAGPTVQFVQVSYASNTGPRHLTVPVGELPHSIMRRTNAPAKRWFAINAPGCLESLDIRMDAFGPHHVFLGSAKGLDQRAACHAGLGYKTKGRIIYGSLPLSLSLDPP
jgi:hypothetical protein